MSFDLRKSLAHKKLESKVPNVPTSSSPLRRSLIVQNLSSSILSENDDEAERLARRREICTSTPLSSRNVLPRRQSLNMGFLANIPVPQMAECIKECIKLNAENKINVKNAFSLEMIDFMTYMIKKQDANMSNLQVASTSLDVSTKIYGFRVDSVYTEILKIVGGLDKQTADDAKQNLEEEGDALQENAEANVEVQKKKRKKAKQKIFSTVEALKGNIEIVKPISMMIGEGDLQTSDMLHQAVLPNHASSGFYQHPYNDVLVDVVEKNQDESQNNSDIKYCIPVIGEFSNLEICATYSNFDFLNWSVENEPEEMPVMEGDTDEDDDRFQFDLNASVEQDDNPEPEPMNYFDIEHDDDNDENNVHVFHQKVANRQAKNVKDVHDVQILNTSEYSFVQPHGLHWAGPFHWKFRNIARFAATAGANVKVVGACMQAPQRKRKRIELLYDNDNCDVLDAKFVLSKSNKLQAKTAKMEWSTKNIVLPEDVHYDITHMTHKLYLHQLIIVNSKYGRGKQNDDDAVNIANVSDNERYDYNNPNDTLDYCANVNNSDYDDMDRDNCNSEDDAAPLSSPQAFTGDNLVVAPKLANKISIAYCLKAKKVDMRQLKKSIWTCLKSPNNTADVINIQEAVEEAQTSMMKDSKEFSNVYKMLPKLLTKNNAEALSVPISFISLLHLANEKNLKIYSLSDMSDIIIEASTERG